MSAYAPANDKGEKPYVVEQAGWGRKRSKVVYANTPAEAKYRAYGRQGVGEYIIGCRRATPEDLAGSNGTGNQEDRSSDGISAQEG